MCGICGKISRNDIVTRELIGAMNDALRHRGPDDEGVYIGPRSTVRGPQINVGLGHRRLSIIDLSEAGHQPMCNEDGTIWIVLNGEIYNFAELKEMLEKKGHKFRSRTDTEVILHLYEERGADCVNDLRGMFAFAVWDIKAGRLILARDRLGKKPLYYSYKNGDLVFASELKALLKDVTVGRTIDLASIDDFLAYQYIPAPHTVFKEINKLPPAHILVWENGQARVTRYWRLDYSKKINLREEEYCERVMELLKDSTKLRLTSDVPLGAFLSGGIDSSAIVAVASKIIGKPVKTFSIGFENAGFDERPYAGIIAERFGTEHREFIVQPNALEILPELIAHFGEPYGDSSAIPAYYLSKMTRSAVTVALSGDAGDESFGGYDRYLAVKAAGCFRGPLAVFSRLFKGSIDRLSETTAKKDSANRLKRFLNIVELDGAGAYSRLMSLFDDDERAGLYSGPVADEIRQTKRPGIILEEMRSSGINDVVDSMLYTDLATYMPGDLLPKVDITSMMHALEVRSPFLDHKFLEFSAQIPSRLKIRGLTSKYILKKALRGELPDKIIKRKKEGFGVPVGEWFRNELKSYAYEVLLDNNAVSREYFKIEKIEEMLEGHVSGKINNGARLWCLINLELWHRIFIR